MRQILRDHVPALSLRAASLYGEHDSGSMSRLIRSVAKGRFVLPMNGAVPKCLLYAGSLAGVIADDVTSHPLVAWRARAIADLHSYTLADVVAAIEKAVGREARRIPISPRLMSLGIAPAEIAGRLLRSRKLVELAGGARTALTPIECWSDNLLNDHPGQEIDLVDGVRREVEWLRASRLL
jgi:nucleoside-diphosphate-sugar epimerase